jgi:Cu/Ag efflux pump CusA
MTALTAGLALVPLALSDGEPGNELQTLMAIVILGGLLSATALNMVVVPALYWLFGEQAVERGAAFPEPALIGQPALQATAARR